MLFAPPKDSHSIPPTIVIWIHGTRTHAIFPPTHVGRAQNKITLLLDKDNPYSPLGIHSLLTVNQELHVAAIGQAIHESDPERYLQDHIYLFGWSGDFTPEARAAAGAHLYAELERLRAAYRTHYGACPPITIITHSHGGNVALEAGAHYDGSFTIDKLILLACPVQEKTKPYLESPLFTTVYSIHSHKDYFQVLDVQGLHPVRDAVKSAIRSLSFEPIKHAWQKNRDTKLFSERHYTAHPNLKQACVEWKKTREKWSNKDLSIMEPYFRDLHVKKLQSKLQQYDQRKRGLMHVEFLFPTFLHQLPQIITLLDTAEMPADERNPSVILEI